MRLFRLFQRKNSGNVARERLKHLLMNDRMNISAELAEQIHKDLLRTISKYLEVDERGLSVQFEKNKEGQETYIKVLIPVIAAKQRR